MLCGEYSCGEMGEYRGEERLVGCHRRGELEGEMLYEGGGLEGGGLRLVGEGREGRCMVCGTGTKVNDAKTGCVAAVTCGTGTKVNRAKTGCVGNAAEVYPLIVGARPGEKPGAKTIAGVPAGLVCPALVTKAEWYNGYTYPDTFRAVVSGTTVVVTRTDTGDERSGWGMDLAFTCFLAASAKASALTSGVDNVTALDGNALAGQTASGAAGAGGGGNDVPVSWASETVAVCAVLITIFLAMLVCVNVSNARLQRVDADDEDAGGNGAYQGGVTSVASVSEL